MLASALQGSLADPILAQAAAAGLGQALLGAAAAATAASSSSLSNPSSMFLPQGQAAHNQQLGQPNATQPHDSADASSTRDNSLVTNSAQPQQLQPHQGQYSTLSSSFPVTGSQATSSSSTTGGGIPMNPALMWPNLLSSPQSQLLGPMAAGLSSLPSTSVHTAASGGGVTAGGAGRSSGNAAFLPTATSPTATEAGGGGITTGVAPLQLHHAEHAHPQHSDEGTGSSSPAPKRQKRAYHHESFPAKLHRLLQETEQAGEDDVISWNVDGTIMCIHQPEVFEEQIIGRYFRHSKLASFKRQLSMYGFTRVLEGPDAGGFSHPFFRRGKPELSQQMFRVSP